MSELHNGRAAYRCHAGQRPPHVTSCEVRPPGPEALVQRAEFLLLEGKRVRRKRTDALVSLLSEVGEERKLLVEVRARGGDLAALKAALRDDRDSQEPRARR